MKIFHVLSSINIYLLCQLLTAHLLSTFFFFTKDQPSATCRRLRNFPPPSLRMRCWSSEPAFQFIPQQTCPPPGILHRIRVQYELRMHLVLNWPDRYPTIYLAGERSFLALNSRGKKGFSKNYIYFSILICFCLFSNLFLFPGFRTSSRVFTILKVPVQHLAGCRDSNPSCCDCRQVGYQ